MTRSGSDKAQAIGSSLAVFIGLTGALFGLVAFLTGQAVADTWRPAWQAVASALGLAVAARCHPPQDPRLTGESARMVLNGAYLLDDEHIDEFLAAAAALDDRHPGLRVGVTGPWPPYSFATVDEKDF